MLGSREKLGSHGFTLVELLVVVSVIGILSAIAYPQFNSYREKANCAKVKHDLSNIAVAQESNFIFDETYIAIAQNGDASSNLQGFTWSPGVVLISSAGDLFKWSAVADHPGCTMGPFTYDSDLGGLQR